ncbi:NAD(P)H-dependent oxidoreductase [Streptococcus dentiloxodontae]
MKTTIFLFHPHLNSQSRVNKALAEAAAAAEFEVRDMYSIYPDFQIDAKAEQEILEATNRIVLQYPIYWYQTPALLKQWFDDVLQYGWAYGSKGTALQGKEIILAPSFGAGAADYTLDGRFHTTIAELLKPIETIQYHTGLVFKEAFVITGALNLTDEEIAEKAQAYVAHITK